MCESLPDFVPDLDPALTVAERVAALDAGFRAYLHYDPVCERQDAISSHDAELLLQYSHDPASEIRKSAVRMLCETGPVSWESVESWMFDPDEEVRRVPFFHMELDSDAICTLFASDRDRWASLVARVAERFGQLPLSSPKYSAEGPEWFDALWPQIGLLVDKGIHDLNVNIVCGYLEDALVYEYVRPGDPRLDDWVYGNSRERKMALLAVVAWFGAREDWQQRIAVILKDDVDMVVAEAAGEIVDCIDPGDILAREWSHTPPPTSTPNPPPDQPLITDD